MKVLHVINNLGSGGAESMLLNFAKHVNGNANSNVIIDILLLTDDKISYFISKNVNIYVLSSSSARWSFFKFIKLCRFIRDGKYDIVHSHLFPTQYYIGFCKLFLPKKVKIVTTEHNTTNTRRKFFITRFIDRKIYNLYDYIFFISDGVKKHFNKDYTTVKIPQKVIYNGIPLIKFKSKGSHNSDDKIKLIMVGSFSNQKDHETLIKALSLLPDSYTLSLIGEGKNLDKIKKMVEGLNMAKRVFFKGFVNNVEECYRKHDIFILSSHWEGFGLVVVEAMASGLPVIASDVAGLKEVVKGAGLLFTQGNHTELVKHIKKITMDDAFKKDLINKGYERAKKYSISNLTKETLTLYRKITNGVQ